jgi:glycosyltransferase involved in cell wall biosynthesis
MVFAEALCAGIPVVFANGASIDGFFKAEQIGAAVAAGDVEAVAAAMRRLVDGNEALRATVRAMREAGELDIFLPASIKARYESLVHSLLPS